MFQMSTAILFAALAAAAPDEMVSAVAKIVNVSNEQQIPATPSTASYSNPDIAMDWTLQNQVIASADSAGAGIGSVLFFSSNGGVTWGQTSLPPVSGDAFQAGAQVEWTANHTAWALVSALNASGTAVRARLYQSLNNGATWTFDSTLSGTQGGVTLPALTADRFSSSPYRGNLYGLWTNGTAAYVARRTAGGAGTPVQVSGAETTGTAIPGEITTDSAGTVYAFWADTGSRSIFYTNSTSGGVSFRPAARIATTYDSYDIGIPASSRRVLISVTGGVFKTKSRSILYAAWMDLSGNPGCTSAANEPGSNPASICKTRIWVSRSVDGGSWSTPVKINDTPGLGDQFSPRLIVDPTNGVVTVSYSEAYYDETLDASRRRVYSYLQSSYDHGATWEPAFMVNSSFPPPAGGVPDLGTARGLDGFGCNMIGAWTDSRSGSPAQIWTSSASDRPCLQRLYTNSFEIDPGFSDWTVFTAYSGSGGNDWQGIQGCVGATGKLLFRMGGTTCTGNYAGDAVALAQPMGANGIKVPVNATATDTRLSFWHRRAFESGFDGGTLLLSLNGTSFIQVPATAIIGGSGYNGTVQNGLCTPPNTLGRPIFTGRQATYVQTVVDLDQVCNQLTGGTGCAGQILWIAFTSIADCVAGDDGWSIDDVEVTAKVP